MNNSQKNENFEDNGSIVTKKDGICVETITIIGQVEGHYLLPENQKSTKYEHLIPLIVEAEQNEETKGILVILNTVGGDVEAGLALAEMIASLSKPTVSLVIGGGHSIGVPLAVSADRSFIVPSATMTVHPVRITGLVVGSDQTYTYFKKMQKRITDFVITHSSCKKEHFEALLRQNEDMATDIGSILEGKDAVKLGLIDEEGGLSEALNYLKKMIKDSE